MNQLKLFNISIKIDQDVNFIQFISQLQEQCQNILSIIEINNIQTLHYYEKKQQLPKNIKFISNVNDIYQFCSEDDTKYYIFGWRAAKIFFPSLELTTKKMKPIITEYISQYKHKILYDKGKKYKFPYNDKKLIITTIYIFNTTN